MDNLIKNLLLIATGATIGAVAYMAVKHPVELKNMVDGAIKTGQAVIQNTGNKTAENSVATCSDSQAQEA